jgi:hypothetical protein
MTLVDILPIAIFFLAGFFAGLAFKASGRPSVVNTAINASDCVMTGGPQNCPDCGAKL